MEYALILGLALIAVGVVWLAMGASRKRGEAEAREKIHEDVDDAHERREEVLGDGPPDAGDLLR